MIKVGLTKYSWPGTRGAVRGLHLVNREYRMLAGRKQVFVLDIYVEEK